MRTGVLIMYIYSYLYYDVTQVTIIKDYLLLFKEKDYRRTDARRMKTNQDRLI